MNKIPIIITNFNCVRETQKGYYIQYKKVYHRNSSGFFTDINGNCFKINNENELTHDQKTKYYLEGKNVDEDGYFVDDNGNYYYKYEESQLNLDEFNRVLSEPARDENGYINKESQYLANEQYVYFVFKDFPHMFKESLSLNKKLVIKSITCFELGRKKCNGHTIHSNIQRDGVTGIDQCIGVVDDEPVESKWRITVKDLNDGIRLWFRDLCWNYTEPNTFFIIGELQY